MEPGKEKEQEQEQENENEQGNEGGSVSLTYSSSSPQRRIRKTLRKIRSALDLGPAPFLA